jgi:hypothetical protein
MHHLAKACMNWLLFHDTASHTPYPIEQGFGQGHHGWGFSDFPPVDH